MNKTMKKLLSLLLCMCMIFGAMLSLSSCFGKDGDDPDESQSDGNPDESQSESDSTVVEEKYTLNLVEGGTTKYVIVVPNKNKDFTDDMLTTLNQLISALKIYTGAEISWKRDFEGWDVEPDENAYEILIGNTNRHQSADAVEDLGYGEYTIRADGNKLVLNGTTEATIIAAMDYFTINMIKGNPDLGYNKTDADFIFTSEDNYTKRSSYQIKSITVNDKKIANMKIVYPDGDMNAKYAASLIKKHIQNYSGNNLSIVSDANVGYEPAILVGKTKRSSVTAPGGKYLIEVTAKGLEIAVNDMFSYAGVYNTIMNEVLAYSKAHISLKTGDKWDKDSLQEANAARTTDVRVMYQNVWGYMITDPGSLPNPVKAENVSRYAIANAVYDAYNPDVICFQEFNTDKSIIVDHLFLKGYSEVPTTTNTNDTSGKHYSHQPIYYKTSVVQLVNYGTTKGWSHYHSNWAIFKVKATGKTFAVVNSHFTANSMVNQSDPEKVAELGDTARQQDSKALLTSVTAAKNAGPAGMPIITGGDYNCNVESGAYKVLTDGGLANVRDLATVSADISCHHGVSYDENNGSYLLPGKVTSSVEGAIDYIMILDSTKTAVKIKEYGVIGDRMTAISSDHAPHFIDFDFN